MYATRASRSRSSRRGSTLIATVVAVSVMLLLTLAAAQLSVQSTKRDLAEQSDRQALQLAETGLREAAASLIVNSNGNLGSQAAPVAYGDGVFWVVATPQEEEQEWLLKSTALYGSGRASVEAAVRRQSNGSINRALFSKKKLDMKKGFFMDSYDSELGTYADQATNEHLGVTYANDGGVAASNGDLRLHKDIEIFGSVRAGAGDELKYKDDPSEFLLTGDAGYLAQDVLFETVIMPVAGPELGKVHLHGVKEDPPEFDLVLSPGEYHYEDFKVHKDAKVKIVGPSVVVVDKKFDIGSSLLIDDSNGPVVVYCGKEAKFKKKASVAVESNRPEGFFVVMAQHVEYDEDGEKVKKKKTKVKIETTFTGVVYGPEAKIELKKEAEVFGSVMGNEVKFKKGARFHYDEALGRINAPFGGDRVSVELLFWRAGPVADATLMRDRRAPEQLLGVHVNELSAPYASWKPEPFDEQDEFDPWGPDDFSFDEEEEDNYDDPEDEEVWDDDEEEYLEDEGLYHADLES